MVSYPDSQGAERSLAIRPPPSVTSHSSRASTVRRHRPHRSHFGGSSYQPQNEFPVFTHTGDVEIIISNGRKEQRYLLHKLILAQCSGFFEAGLSDEWATAGEGASQTQNSAALARIPSSASTDKKRWRYELDWGKSDDDVPMLIQKKAQPSLFAGDSSPPALPPPTRNKPVAPQSGFFRSMANFSSLHVASTPETPPTLDPINIANAYVECKSLLQLGDMYDALEVIGPRVDHHLLRFQGRLWKQIAKYPPSYLKLGYMARSKAIFSEAMVHVVGQWPMGASQLRGQTSEAVIELIEDKVDEMEEMKARVEGKLFRITLSTSRGERVTPSNNMLEWLSMSLFRQWLAENTTPPPTPILKSSTRAPSSSRHPSSRHSDAGAGAAPPPFNTGRVFRLLGTGGSSYLNHDECKRFLRLCPEQYNRENLKRFERRMDEIKERAKDVVKPLMRNFLELDLGSNGGLPYLTCTRVEVQDFPWDE
ncbi:hypothetical protein M011DRAFT_276648 [Sporormia fimetaria CBS 119925]|uniref:BTB domain-containing protein n=1 Tax=Sporormia fimetaria CBS 119925 TaxID=1340428 RepID=A0A6A6VGP7_9PLEO|nr:hypothetical protein M011DRAFT_276648 [Sporormia fimetaria CBS 119925]